MTVLTLDGGDMGHRDTPGDHGLGPDAPSGVRLAYHAGDRPAAFTTIEGPETP